MVEYEIEFLRLIMYARALVSTNYDMSVQFKEELRYDLKVFFFFIIKNGPKGRTSIYNQLCI